MPGYININHTDGVMTQVNIHNIATVRVSDCRNGQLGHVDVSVQSGPTEVTLFLSLQVAELLAAKLAKLLPASAPNDEPSCRATCAAMAEVERALGCPPALASAEGAEAVENKT